MKIQVHINKKSIPINDRALNFGDGLFETIHIKNNKPLFIDDHIKRLNNGCKKLSIPTVPGKLLKDSVYKSIANTNNCIIKIIYSRGLSQHGYQFDRNIIPQLYIFKKNINKNKNKLFVSLGYSKYNLHNNSFLSKIKHLNRIEQILGFTMSNTIKHDDYILLDNDKNIIETISSNIFFYRHQKGKFNFITPKLTSCGVDGVMKGQLIKLIKGKNIKIIQKDILKKDIIKYTGCFTCNVVKGVQFVNKIEKVKMNHVLQLEELLKHYIYE